MTDLIVVTGGRGRLGSAVVERLERDVWQRLATGQAAERRVIVSVDVEHAPSRGGIWEVCGDVLDESDLRGLMVEATGPSNRVAALVCLHGLDAVPTSDASDPWRDWQAFLDVNLTGTMNACRVFGQAMVEAGRGGSIVTVGSLYGVQAPDQRLYSGGFTKAAGYAASKAGVIGFTRWLAAYWGQHNIRVNCLCPGGVANPAADPAFEQRYIERVPLGRMATPEDVASWAAFLVSDQAAYMTGQTIVVDGGASIW